MVQLAATYTSEENPVDKPPLFMGNLPMVFIGLLALAGFVVELVVGFKAKPWWEALLLPIPPFAFASVWYKRHNPAPPFFTGIFALLLALLGKLVSP